MTSTRVTLRHVAEAAGVSLATASYAMRNDPKIAAETRERVQARAAKLGYRPDPEMERLMARLRGTRVRPVATVLALLDFSTGAQAGFLREDPFSAALVEEAKRRAEALGYRLERFQVGERLTMKRVAQIFRARRIQGAILATPVPVGAMEDFPWAETFVVATVPPEGLPPMTRVHAHQFANMSRLCEVARAKGYRRIALSTTERLDRLQGRVVTAAFAWQAWQFPEQFQGEVFFARQQESSGEPKRLREWFGRVRPDAVLCSDEWEWQRLQARVGKRQLKGVGCATFGNKRPGLSGMDTRPAVIGSAVIDVLTAHLQRNELGLPKVPKTTMIEGAFADEGTL